MSLKWLIVQCVRARQVKTTLFSTTQILGMRKDAYRILDKEFYILLWNLLGRNLKDSSDHKFKNF